MPGQLQANPAVALAEEVLRIALLHPRTHKCFSGRWADWTASWTECGNKVFVHFQVKIHGGNRINARATIRRLMKEREVHWVPQACSFRAHDRPRLPGYKFSCDIIDDRLVVVPVR